MQADAALVQFCTAQCELAKIDDATSIARRHHTRSASTFRDLLKEQMVAANASCVPVMCGGKQKYATLRRGRANVTVTSEAVMAALRDAAYEMSRTPSTTVEEWVEQHLRTALTKEAPAASARPSLSIVAKRPEGPMPPVHPSSASKIQETVESLHATTETVRTLRRESEGRRKELRAISKEAEESVATHLAAHDPEHGTRRLRLVHEGKESTYYLRRKQATRTSKPTMRTALPAVRQVIRTLREEAGVDAPLTWETYRWLTSPATLAKVERHVAQCLDTLNVQKTSARVVLTGV